MKKNRVMFFQTAILGVVAVFLFSAIIAAPQARAYAVGSVPSAQPAGTEVPGPATGVSGSSYDIGTSLQNLISPFTGFINDLRWTSGTTLNPNGTSFAWPTVNVTPVLESTFQNTLSQWFSQFSAWFYGISGVQLSGIFIALLNLFSWVLGLAQQVVNWLLGVIH